MTELPPKIEGVRSGWWKGLENDVWMHCPMCDFEFLIEQPIDADGTTADPVICPMECGFSDRVKATNWVSAASEG